MTARLAISYEPLGELIRWPRNPKLHASEGIRRSVRRFGFNVPLLVDEVTNRLVEGHGRLDVLVSMKRAGEKPPTHIDVRVDGEWLVPVTRGVKFESIPEAEAYIILSNHLVEKGGWDPDLTREVIHDLEAAELLEFEDIGIDLEALNALANASMGDEEESEGEDEEESEDEEEPYEAPEPDPITKRGDLWKLGDHRLLCGDSLKDDEVDSLLNGTVPKMILSDSPYAIYGSSSGIGPDITDDKMVLPFFETLMRQVYRTLPLFGHAYVHCDWRSWAVVWNASRTAKMTPKNLIIWDKGNQGLGSLRTMCHEFVGLFARSPRAKSVRSSMQTGERKILGKPNIVRYNRPAREERLHNAAKPVAMLSEFIEDSSDAGDVVLDLFSGSGSGIIAAERSGRVCYALDVEPGWCDVAVRRWEKSTGKKAERVEASKRRKRRSEATAP